MDGLTVLQCNNPKKPGGCLTRASRLALQTDTAVGLFSTVERCSHIWTQHAGSM